MADVVLLGANAPANSNSATSTRTISYTVPAGTNRVLIVPFSVVNEFGGVNTSIADVTAAFNSLPMTVQGNATFQAGGLSNDKCIQGVATVAIPDIYSGAYDFTITLGGSSNRLINYQFWTFGNVMVADASVAALMSVLGGDLTLTPVVAASGDLIFTFGALGSATQPTYLPAPYLNSSGAANGSFSQAPSGYNVRGRCTYALAVTGVQSVQWTGVSTSMRGGITLVMRKAGGSGDTTQYNCQCVDEDDFQPLRTLEELREEFLTLTGYAAQIANPPPSAVVLANTHLRLAQRLMYMKYPALRTRRMFRWQMLEGVRFYELNENDEDPNCGFSLNPYKAIEWVGVRNPNGQWLQMVDGISPSFYTMVDQVGTPAYYEIRQCIEVLPAPPADGYELWIKGHFGLQPFVADADVTTIDSDLVLLLAVANRKAAQGSPDAGNYASMATSRLGELTAGTHTKKRYIPGTVNLPPAVMPVFLPTVS